MTLAHRLETRTATLATLATTLLTTTTGTVVAHTNGAIGGAHSWGGHMWGDGWMVGPEWMGLWGLLWMGVFIAIPLALVYLATRRETERKTDSAAAVLRERYARGEIDDDEFELLRAKLS